jgi:hypothetical protein
VSRGDISWTVAVAPPPPSQPRGLRKLLCNNTAAVGLSVYDELGGKFGCLKKMKR